MKHSILLTSFLILSGSLAACSSGDKTGGSGSGGTGGVTTGGSGGTSGVITGGSSGTGGASSGSGGSAGEAVFCDAPAMIFSVNTDNDVNGQPVTPSTPLAQKKAGCIGSGCHSAVNVGAFPPDLETANPEARLLDKQSMSFFCGGTSDVYINSADVENSMILRVIAPHPTCGPTGMGTIEQMPFGSTQTPQTLPALTADQVTCIHNWVRYVVQHH
ncbi:MAG TPA: hypothetical protein VL137_09855 [Polyangiaceae bacterium]|jgi:hypothetical protein|nr:hypothetical protein [Polyangiaceae bacterium]